MIQTRKASYTKRVWLFRLLCTASHVPVQLRERSCPKERGKIVNGTEVSGLNDDNDGVNVDADASKIRGDELSLQVYEDDGDGDDGDQRFRDSACLCNRTDANSRNSKSLLVHARVCYNGNDIVLQAAKEMKLTGPTSTAWREVVLGPLASSSPLVS